MISSARYYDRWLKKVVDLFRQGLSPRDIGLSVSIGVLVGIMPIFGLATILIAFYLFTLG